MSFNHEPASRQDASRQDDAEALDPELKSALADFRLSFHAFSDAAYARARMPLARAPRRGRVWRLVAGCALGCVLLAGSVSSGVYRHHRKEVGIAQAREAQHQRQLAADRASQQAREEEDLLAKVDSVIARQTPSAMEPLARLMSDDETR